MHKLKFASAVCLILLIAALAACGKTNNAAPAGTIEASGSPGGEDAIQVGFVVPDSANPFFIHMTEAISQGLKQHGIDLQVASANMDVNKSINAIETFVSAKVDVLIVSPVDEKAVEPALEAARKAGIKVLSFGGELNHTDVNLLSDQAGIGKALGENAAAWVNDKLGGSAEVGLIVFTATNNVTVRANALEEALKAGAPGAKIVAKQEAASVADAQKVAENMLQAHPNIQVIATNADTLALGVLEAVKAAGRADENFYINGSDATPQVIDKIKEGGPLRVTIDMGVERIPAMTVEAVLRLAKGEQTERNQYALLTLVDSSNVGSY